MGLQGRGFLSSEGIRISQSGVGRGRRIAASELGKRLGFSCPGPTL